VSVTAVSQWLAESSYKGLAVNRTDERDARQEVPAEPDVHAAAHDLTAAGQPGTGAGESRTTEPLARMTADAQIVVGAIPAQRPGFQPRPALLGRMNQTSQKASVVVLTGAQGAGKTQLAASHARAMLAAGWRLIAWVNAQDSESVRAGLAAVADATGLSDDGSVRSPVDPGQAVRHWLEAGGERCLLVFDNAEDLDVLRPFVPVEGAARVLITAARESVADLGARVPVSVFSADEAQAFLEGRTGLADRTGAAALAAELGYLPLALDQAAGTIAGRRLGHGTYLQRLRAMRAGEGLVHDERGKEQPYPKRVAEAVLLSLEAVRAGDESGVCTGVLETVAVLSPGGVRRELLHAAGEAGVLADGGYTADTALVDRAVEWLTARSLLTPAIDGHTVIMHGLVRRVICAALARRERLTEVCLAVGSVLKARAEAVAESQDRPAIRDIPQQVSALLVSAPGPEGGPDQTLARLLLRLRFWALYCLIELRDSTPQAIALGEALAADLDRALGPNHLETLNSQNSLAVAYRAADRVADAVPLFERTLVAQTRLLGADHLDTLMSQNNLAAAYRDVGRSVEAILLFERTLAARERLLGADHPSTLNSRGNLAAAYRDVGRSAEAIPLFEQILTAEDRVLGPDHPDTLRSRAILAAVYQAADLSAEAIPLLEQILAARERLLGPDHTDTMASRTSLASAYRKCDQVAQAIPLVQQTLAAQERLLGADHPSALASRNNLASAYRATGRPAEAIPLFEMNVAAYERLLGVDHPKTVASRHRLDLAGQESARAEDAGGGPDEPD
jgi:tetratricopeptide (TPR) repeat protein